MTDLQVSTYISGAQNTPALALTNGWDAVFVWTPRGQHGHLGGVFMPTAPSLTCSLRRSLVATERGEVPVEDLGMGDPVAIRLPCVPGASARGAKTSQPEETHR
jgi:hypothetical protein